MISFDCIEEDLTLILVYKTLKSVKSGVLLYSCLVGEGQDWLWRISKIRPANSYLNRCNYSFAYTFRPANEKFRPAN